MNLKLFKITFLIIIGINFLACAQQSDNQTKAIVTIITADELNDKLGDIQLVDVRTPEEFADGHIKDAVNINFFDDDFVENIAKLDKNKDLYIYCRSDTRSGKATAKIKSLGFVNIKDLKGGFLNWDKKSFEVVK